MRVVTPSGFHFTFAHYRTAGTDKALVQDQQKKWKKRELRGRRGAGDRGRCGSMHTGAEGEN